MTFGICLKTLLTSLNISMSQLARAINVDSSLVCRWVHGSRIPSNIYIDNIAEYLSKIPVSPVQLRIIEELIFNLNISTSTLPEVHKERIQFILHQSLINSKKLTNKKYNKKNVNELQGKELIYNNAVNLSEQDKLLFGIDNIYEAFHSLLDTAILNQKDIKNKKIYLTYNDNTDTSIFSEDLIKPVVEKLLYAIEHNWEIHLLIRLDSSANILIKFINYILPLIKTGKVKLYHLTNSDNFMTRKELYIISDVGALSCFPSDINNNIKCAFMIMTPLGIEVLSNYAKMLKEYNSTEIIEYYNIDMSKRYVSTLTESIEKIGIQYRYNNSFIRLLLPENLYIKLVNQIDMSKEEKELSIYYFQKQCQGLFKNLCNHKFMDIYFKSRFNKLCESKSLYLQTYTGIKAVTLENQDLIEYLEHIKYIIHNYPNYNMAIVYNNHTDFINNITLYIKEREIVYLDVFDNHEAYIRLSINDPIIVNAFVNYYHAIWQKISPLNKEKEEVLSLIEDYINMIKDNRI